MNETEDLGLLFHENALQLDEFERTPAPQRKVIFVTIVSLITAAILGLTLIWAGQLSAKAGETETLSNPAAEAHPEPTPDISSSQPQANDAAAKLGEGEGQRSAAENESSERVIQADPLWVAQVSKESGVPERALKAYATAALVLRDEQPGCGLGWNTLAAIGQVESGHGTIHGASLASDGRALPRIVGVALDGEVYQAIPDTDSGLIDGDAVWDRAVGPMQFIPQTWAVYGRSAGGSAEPDIDQIDDAALSAATLLCAEGGDLTTAENWIRAVQAYNPSVAYNNDVADIAEYYGAFG